MPLQPKATDVPIEACRFAADFKPGTADQSTKTVPFTALARTAKPVPHWYWGERCLHDFSGMEAAESCVVDWEHYGEVMGFANKVEVLPDIGLQLSGMLTPFKPDDMATEVAHKAALGVPYQTSIDFDERELVVEDVPAGFSATVNGTVWEGPLTIFRKWKLRGLGVCKYGVDGDTKLKFAQAKLSGKTVSVTRFSKGAEMSTGTTETPAADPAPTTPAVPAPAVTPAAGTETVAPAGTTQLSRKQQSESFLKEFGEQHGPTLFSRHDRIEDARIEFTGIMRAENERLRAEVTKFSQAKPAPQGESPVSFSGGGGDTPGTTKWSHMPATRQKICSATKMPGSK